VSGNFVEKHWSGDFFLLSSFFGVLQKHYITRIIQKFGCLKMRDNTSFSIPKWLYMYPILGRDGSLFAPTKEKFLQKAHKIGEKSLIDA
jgi:hypothetical protein